MSRRTIVTALAALLLLGGSGAALADDDPLDPYFPGEGTSVCVRTDGPNGERDGVCAYVPIGRR